MGFLHTSNIPILMTHNFREIWSIGSTNMAYAPINVNPHPPPPGDLVSTFDLE